MNRVLIVDDESLVVKSLMACVDWNAYGFEIIGQANDGDDAYDMILELKPDIVFTDIRMPGLNGLDLIKKVNDAGLGIYFIVISGFADFNYARKAMGLGALGYCLKPFDRDEIVEMLKKTTVILGNRKSLDEVELLSALDDNTPEGRMKTKGLLERLGFKSGGDNEVSVLVTVGAAEINLPGETRSVHLKVGRRKNLYLLQYGPSADVKKYLQADPPPGISGMGFYSCKNSDDSFQYAIEEATIAAYGFFMNKGGTADKAGKIDQDRLNSTMKMLEEAIASKESMPVQNALDSIEKLFLNGEFKIIHAFQVYNMVVSLLFRFDSELYDGYIYNYEHLAGVYRNVSAMIANLKELTKQHIGAKSENKAVEISSGAFKRILEYVNRNYCRNISLQSISSEFNFNPSYISQLFHREAGETLTEYITGLRMKNACDLLKTTSLSIYEVAEKNGYDDYFYFARVFKRAFGTTPSLYRNENINN